MDGQWEQKKVWRNADQATMPSFFFFFRCDKIKGLPEAFDTPGVGSNYIRQHVEKTNKAIQDFQVPEQIPKISESFSI